MIQHRRSVLFAIIAAAAAWTDSAGQDGKGSAMITGRTTNEIGNPIQGLITIVSGALIQRQLTEADGVFRFEKLPGGKYFLCGKAAPTVFDPRESRSDGQQPLDSCEWLSAGSQAVNVSSGQTLAGVTVGLSQGTFLKIRVADPAKLIKKGSGRHTGNELSLRVSGPDGLVHRIPILDEDDAGRNYGLVIPYNVPHDLQFQSRFVTLRDNRGQDVASGRIPVRVFKGGPRAEFSFVASPRSPR